MDTATIGTQSASTTNQMTRYMWVIAVQWPTGGGFGSASLASTVDIPAGASRLDIYLQVVELAKRETGAKTPNVVFFSLEPDRLDG
ncbi:hypothetical protein [Nonomuraea roseola]|uniref:Uncharacterized protein n=1 Tax=Nonomuraea roseola TaxID=46179 RepID=A0ABV5QHV4_9ACTN